MGKHLKPTLPTKCPTVTAFPLAVALPIGANTKSACFYCLKTEFCSFAYMSVETLRLSSPSHSITAIGGTEVGDKIMIKRSMLFRFVPGCAGRHRLYCAVTSVADLLALMLIIASKIDWIAWLREIRTSPRQWRGASCEIILILDVCGRTRILSESFPIHSGKTGVWTKISVLANKKTFLSYRDLLIRWIYRSTSYYTVMSVVQSRKYNKEELRKNQLF